MITGTLNTESLTQAFRTLSQRRKHGVLEVNTGNVHFGIIFSAGKIAQVRDLGGSAVQAVCDKLIQAGKLNPDSASAASEQWEGFDALREGLVGSQLVNAEDFELALESYQMDLLYSLRRAKSGFMNFSSQVVEINRSVSLNLAPGQVLLDMVELEAEEERMAGELGGIAEIACWVHAQGAAAGGLTSEEERVWRSTDAARHLEELQRLTLLSEYQLREALNALCSRGLLEVVIDDSLNEIAEKNQAEESQSEQFDVPESESDPDGEGEEEDLDTLIRKAAEMLCEVDDAPKEASAPPPASVQKERPATAPSKSQSPAFPQAHVVREAALPVVEPERMTWRRFVEGIQFLDDESLSLLSLVLSIFFLWLAAWFLPLWVDDWFLALRAFASMT